VSEAYLLLERLEAHGVNAEANPYIAGLPAVTAFTGFAHRLERDFLLDSGITVRGTAILLHRFQQHRGHPKTPPALADIQLKDGDMNPPIVDELKGDGVFSLLLRLVLPAGDETDDFADDDFADEPEAPAIDGPGLARRIARYLPALPLAGGGLASQGRTLWLDDKPESITRQLRRLADASLLIERNDLLEPPAGGSTGAEDGTAAAEDALDRWLRALALLKIEDKWGRAQPGWIVPLALGYRALEPVQQRAGSRGGRPHVYAEPVCGLGECVPLIRILRAEHPFTELREKGFWRHVDLPDDGLFIVTTRSA